ncbi:MAG: 4-hydroxy-tetrahydrodipicolinate synthase [Polyangiaceae bacterium]|nr:4-hydroxy-tetrahydrodipicolinate synthase [Polyangiaceae bacterium]MCW5789263.1 4-hydroxy-tetrahydrodipicolinate synthase [Polyangiaceae bacterium]
MASAAELKLEGTFTAVVTPFTASGAVDYERYQALLERQAAAGVGLVPCGTTGETPTLSDEEQRELIRLAVQVARGRVPVLAGTGSNDTEDTKQRSIAALELGASGVMLVMPYYNRPSQAGLVHHVEIVAQAAPGPVVLYDIPSRTGVSLSLASKLTLLDRCPNVVGVKDASGNVLACQQLLAKAGERVAVMCGDDALTLPMMAVGARGVISVSANALPQRVSQVPRLMLEGRLEEARARHLALLDFHAAMFEEPNPAPVKAALALLGQGEARLRSPLLPVGEATVALISGILEELGER